MFIHLNPILANKNDGSCLAIKECVKDDEIGIAFCGFMAIGAASLFLGLFPVGRRQRKRKSMTLGFDRTTFGRDYGIVALYQNGDEL